MQVAILEYKSIICAGYSAVMHIHTCAEEVSIKVSAACQHSNIKINCYVVRHIIAICSEVMKLMMHASRLQGTVNSREFCANVI